MPSYTKSFKESVVKKITSPNGPNALTLSKEINVPYGTIRRWITTFGSEQMSKNQPKVNHRNSAEKFALINEYSGLKKDAKGAFLRMQGVTDAHLELWKKEFIEALAPQNIKQERNEKKTLKKNIKSLQKELRRKDKALAETTALLVLKKKVDLLFGEGEE
jgi:transposase